MTGRTTTDPMMTGEIGRWRVLSCYTANLAAYLAAISSADETSDRIARSVRLAVRPDSDGLAFSHHWTPLHQLPGGDSLAYHGADDRDLARDGLCAEIERAGQLLVLAHSDRLPWSMSTVDAPHLLLLDGFERDRWHVVDHFAGLLPSGAEQEPYVGWVDSAALLDLMHGIEPFTTEQERRNRMFFGFPVPMPSTRWRWLVRTDDVSNPLDDSWQTEPRDLWALVEQDLVARLAEATPPGILDDLWAAAQHHRHRCARLLELSIEDELVTRADTAWGKLPQTLRFAAESARRGRPRAAMVSKTFDELADIEAALSGPLLDCGWAKLAAVFTGSTKP